MNKEKASYGNIFKTTFLFGFVQIINILIKIVLNKIVALLLGAEGMGIIGIYNSVSSMIQTGAGLGISQSAVRDISEANGSNNYTKFSRIISLTNKIIWITSLLGLVVTILFSSFFSDCYFDDTSYTLSFIGLSVVVFLNILKEGQLAILKGMRQLRNLAKASIWGSFVGLIFAIPFYFFWGKGGIIPSLGISTFGAVIFSFYYVRKINYSKINFNLKEFWREAQPMVKMGIALMLVSFVGSVFDMVIAAYISNYGSLEDVGFYNAGAAIMSGYFGVVITAMSTDYYPRISEVYRENSKLESEMNKQSEAGLVLIFPLAILFVFLSPFFINILYSREFYETNNYTDYAMLGTIIIVVSNCMGMILLAKQASNIFIYSVLGQRILLIGVYILGYRNWGLVGLGFAYICTGIIHLGLMSIILFRFYKIRLSKNIYRLLVLIISLTVLTIFLRRIDNLIIRYISGSFVLIFSSISSLLYMKKKMGLDIIGFIKNKILTK